MGAPGELEDAEQAVEQARAEDVQAAAAAFGKGGPVKDADKRERAAVARVNALRTARRGAAQAVDDAGNARLAPIAAARDEWAAGLEAERAAAAARYDAAIAEARAALAALGKAESALSWLRNFDAARARVGQHPSYHGKAQPVFAEDLRGVKHDARQLLELAAKATAPPPLPYGHPGRKPARAQVAAAEEVAT